MAMRLQSKPGGGYRRDFLAGIALEKILGLNILDLITDIKMTACINLSSTIRVIRSNFGTAQAKAGVRNLLEEQGPGEVLAALCGAAGGCLDSGHADLSGDKPGSEAPGRPGECPSPRGVRPECAAFINARAWLWIFVAPGIGGDRSGRGATGGQPATTTTATRIESRRSQSNPGSSD